MRVANMKKYKYILLAAAATLFAAGCTSEIDSDLSSLERRIKTLEEKCKTINSNIESLQVLAAKLSAYTYVDKVTPIKSDGEITGYSILFSDNTEIQVNNGTDAQAPVIGVKKGSDGLYYWTVTFNGESDFIYDSVGQRIPASSQTPLLKIQNGNWIISYDGGDIWHTLGAATAKDGATYFKSVEDSVSYFKITMVDETVIRIPSWSYYTDIQAELGNLNTNLAAMQDLYAAINSKVYISSVTPILSNSQTVGYTFRFSDGSVVTALNGETSTTKLVTKKDEETGVTYWYLEYPDGTGAYLLKDGEPVAVAPEKAKTPVLGIQLDEDNIYYWTISYVGEEPTWLLDTEGQKVKATKVVPALLTGFQVTDDDVTITMASGEQFTFPRYQTFTVRFELFDGTEMNPEIIMTGDDSRYAQYYCYLAIDNYTDDFSIVPIVKDGFVVTVGEGAKKSIVIKAPLSFTEGSTVITFIISDGLGHTIFKDFTINYGSPDA